MYAANLGDAVGDLRGDDRQEKISAGIEMPGLKIIAVNQTNHAACETTTRAFHPRQSLEPAGLGQCNAPKRQNDLLIPHIKNQRQQNDRQRREHPHGLMRDLAAWFKIACLPRCFHRSLLLGIALRGFQCLLKELQLAPDLL